MEGNSREREREGLTVGKVVGKGGRIKGGKGGSKHEQLHLFPPMRVHFITFISYRNTFY